jgi:hypothetical protein
MEKSNRSTVIRLFFCLVLVLVVISCSIFSSLRTATAANATATPTKNANSLRTVTPANSTFGFYFGSQITNTTAKAKAQTTPGAAILKIKSVSNNYIRNGQMSTLHSSWSVIPSLSRNK